MLLSDGTLAKALESGDIAVEPLGPDAIQPSSIDLRLGEDLVLFVAGAVDDPVIDPDRRQSNTIAKRIPEQGFIVEPGEFLLGRTLEEVRVGAGYAMQFTGKSSLARLGLTVHQTAGHIDPGFEGVITLEIQNVNAKPFRLRRDMWIGQVLVLALDKPAERPYGHQERRSRYFGQSTVTESRSWL